MSTNFGSAGIPGTRLNVCGGWVDNIIIYPVLYNTSHRLGAGALMLLGLDCYKKKVINKAVDE